MAQLIKLEDCISRYEKDVFRYTGQYARLKRDRWQRMKFNWMNSEHQENLNDGQVEEEENKRKWFKKKRENEEKPLSAIAKTKTLKALKREYSEELFQFQLKWASSTLREKSRVRGEIYHDRTLRFFLKDLPDNYLVLYKPIVQLKKAGTQLDIILIGPDTVQNILFLNMDEGEVIHPSQNRFWEVEFNRQSRKLISPISAIHRMNLFIDSILNIKETELNISYQIVSDKAYINRMNIPSYIRVVDQSNFESWHKQLKRQTSPIKFQQLKAAKAILDQCVATSYLRPEWDSDDDFWKHSLNE